jgi:hypothetical protein
MTTMPARSIPSAAHFSLQPAAPFGTFASPLKLVGKLHALATMRIEHAAALTMIRTSAP